MAEIRGQADQALKAVATALMPFELEHQHAEIVIYRQNSVSIRVRIIDPDFVGIPKGDRHETVWSLFDSIPEEVQSQVTLLLLLTPEETSTSFANFEFDHPVPSQL